MFSRISPQKIDHIQYLEKEGFFLVDTNVAFEKYTSPHADDDANLCHLYFAESKDEKETVSLAKRSFSYSRFHLDPSFSKETANKVKVEWVRNYFNGQRGDALIVARVHENIAGFLQLIYRSDGVLIIDLIAVDEAYRRKGLAGTMIRFAEKSCGDFKVIHVGTQIANVPSLKLYESLGFRVTSAEYIFHYHNRP
jgi:GNAT superfamily N-acetyltransferase